MSWSDGWPEVANERELIPVVFQSSPQKTMRLHGLCRGGIIAEIEKTPVVSIWYCLGYVLRVTLAVVTII